MSKEVGASGQISLGKKHAGKRYDLITHPDGRIELIPVRAEAEAQAPIAPVVAAPDGWLPPGGYEQCSQWALENRVAIEYYAQQIAQFGTAAEQLQRYLDDNPNVANGEDGQI